MNKEEKTLYSFKTKEFNHHHKEPAWYVNIGIFFLAVAALFIFVLKIYLAALVTILGLIAMYVHSNHEPREIKVEITNKKIKLGRKEYPYKKLKAFWVSGKGLNQKLYLQNTSLLFSVISVPAGQGKKEEIKNALEDLLPEHEHRGEALNDKLTRWLRF